MSAEPGDGATPRVALVLSGAGARGAYEAGALSVLLPALGDRQPRILTGTSAGALNAAMLTRVIDQGPDRAAAALVEAWRTITPADVFRPPLRAAVSALGRRVRGRPGAVAGLLDTTPLDTTVREKVDGFRANIGVAGLEVVAIVASSFSTGGPVVFVDRGGDSCAPVPDDKLLSCEYRGARLGVPHVLASSAFPLAFPPVSIGTEWYLDGGVHLNTPLKPAIDLGATHVLVVGGTPPAGPPLLSPPPNVWEGAGQILDVLMLDKMDEDLQALSRVNQSVRLGTPTSPEHSLIHYAVVRPSDDSLSQVAAGIWRPGWRHLGDWLVGYGGLGQLLHQTQRPGHFLSYLCFHPQFISAAIQQGQADAQLLLDQSQSIRWCQ